MWQQQPIPKSILERSKRQAGSGHELGLWRMAFYLFPVFSKLGSTRLRLLLDQTLDGVHGVLEVASDPRGG